ncbi:MAG: DUF4446 family protein [Propionibacteriales bacterium]|nr:DUF4446 family protein [Propionibacteriales bacterium]
MPLEPVSLTWLTLAALALAVVAFLVSLAAWRRAGRLPSGLTKSAKRPRSMIRSGSGALTTGQTTAQIEALRADAATALRHVAVVRYDAFGDMGGHLSWSLALLDDGGDGVVLTSIHGRSDSRTYAKNVAAWSASQQLSPEEIEAIGFARTTAA